MYFSTFHCMISVWMKPVLSFTYTRLCKWPVDDGLEKVPSTINNGYFLTKIKLFFVKLKNGK